MPFKHEKFKKPLISKRVDAKAIVTIENDETAFQGCAVKKLKDIDFPIRLGHEETVIDFGDHFTGYLHIEAKCGTDGHIPDSPTVISFAFAEMPIELVCEFNPSVQSLSAGWLQNDSKAMVFMPYKGSLERRYSFRYLKLKRTDTACFDIDITALYIEAVSAVDIEKVKPFSSGDALLDKIDRMCVKTLKECEQEVFEDGPKRDRRLWIGDLRLQALVDYQTFNNIDLIKRCIYLFAENMNQNGLVAPCVFPDSPPYVDNWIFLDYSMCLGLCLADYCENTGENELPNELYDVALSQLEYSDIVFDRNRRKINAPFFIDHGNYDRNIAVLGYFSYVLLHMAELAEKLGKPTDWFNSVYKDTVKALLSYWDEKTGLFIAESGEISWQSQVWAALSGALSREECSELLRKTEEYNPPVRMSSPFMAHYYIEALFKCGEDERAFGYIKNYWGAILNAGFDCCPECFDPENERLTPYANVILNSACHAWSCTPSYWIRKYCLKSF